MNNVDHPLHKRMMDAPRHFLLIGNGGGGTSCTQRMLNAHPNIKCEFEKHASGPDNDLKAYQGFAEKETENIWGNKIPIEQFQTRGYTDEQIVRLSDHFKLIWLTRRYSRYFKGKQPDKYRKTWEWTREVYWKCKEKWPERVLQVSWEDLLLRPVVELKRICAFLGVEYSPDMLVEPLNLDKV